MNTEHLRGFQALKIIKKQANGEYRLIRPLRILIKKDVLSALAATYRSDYEKGGILEAQAAGTGSLVITAFHEVYNQSVNGYTYSPGVGAWEWTLSAILERGSIPFAVHTHPLQLGIESYDSKRAIFYLKPSKPDKQIARAGITEVLNLPEVLYTKDSRLQNGFGLSFYTGTIFPASITGITTGQIVSGIAAGLMVLTKRVGLALLAAAYFMYEFRRMPEYELQGNGDLLVNLRP